MCEYDGVRTGEGMRSVEPKTSADTAPLPTPQIAAAGKAFTAQVMCVRVGGAE